MVTMPPKIPLPQTPLLPSRLPVYLVARHSKEDSQAKQHAAPQQVLAAALCQVASPEKQRALTDRYRREAELTARRRRPRPSFRT